MEKLELLYDHYKETCEIARENEKIRNRMFIIVCLIIGLLFLFSYDSNSIIGLIQSWFQGNYNCDLMFSSNIIQAILWIILLIITLRYLGININLDRSYAYISNLEEKINKISKNNIITREGFSYLNNYPILNNITYFLYRIVFPIIYIIVITIKLRLEYIAQSGVNNSLIFQSALGIFCSILIVAYLVENIKDIIDDVIEKNKVQKNIKAKKK